LVSQFPFPATPGSLEGQSHGIPLRRSKAMIHPKGRNMDEP
jgi:hypothetical protein